MSRVDCVTYDADAELTVILHLSESYDGTFKSLNDLVDVDLLMHPRGHG